MNNYVRWPVSWGHSQTTPPRSQILGGLSVTPPAPAPEVLVKIVVVPAQPMPWEFPTILTIIRRAEPPAALPDTPPRPLIVGAQPLPHQRSFVSVEQTFAEAVTPPRPLIVGAQPLPNQRSFVSIEQTFVEPLAVAPAAPAKPLIIASQQLSAWQLNAATYIAKRFDFFADTVPAPPTIARGADMSGGAQAFIHPVRTPPAAALPDTPLKSLVVGAQPIPPAVQPAHVARTPVSPAAAPAEIPPRPLIAGLPWYPAVVGGQIFISSLVPEPQAPASTTPPMVPRIISSTPIPPDVQSPYVAKLLTAPFVFPQVPIKPIVVGAQPIPAAVQAAHVAKTLVPFVAPPAAPPRLVIASPPWHPSIVGGQVFISSLVPVPETPASTTAPMMPRIISSTPIPPSVQTPLVAKVLAPPPVFPQVPIKPVVVAQQPIPWQQQKPNQWISQSSRANPDSLPPTPIIAGGASLAGDAYAFVHKIPTPPFVAPSVPIAAKIIASQPPPPHPTYIWTPKGGRWGDPPPILRRPMPSITFDVSRPPLPYGRAYVRHGFAEALPLLFEGTITGGVLSGASITGAGGVGGSLTGFSRDGYVTGGVR